MTHVPTKKRPGVWPGQPGGYVAGAVLDAFEHHKTSAKKRRAKNAFGTPGGTMGPLKADKTKKRRAD